MSKSRLGSVRFVFPKVDVEKDAFLFVAELIEILESSGKS